MSCCFYLHGTDDTRAAELVARHDGDWASLGSALRLLMAQSQIVPAWIAPRDANGTAGPTCLSVPATDAIERLEHLRHIVEQHPLLPEIAALPHYLKGAVAFLRERVARHQHGHGGQVMLVGQYEGDEEQEGFRFNLPLRQELHDALWDEIQRIGVQETHHELDAELQFDSAYLGFVDWEAWTKCFGLCEFQHPYFSRLSDAAYWHGESHALGDLRYESFDPALERKRTQNRLLQARWAGTDYEPCQENGLWGLQHKRDEEVDDETQARPEWALAPEWHELRRDAARGDAVWARRDDLWGLLRLGQPCQLVVPPSFERVVDDVLESGDGEGVELSGDATVVRQHGRHGVVSSADGRWLAPPQYDEVGPPSGGMRRVRQCCSHGFVNSEGACAVPVAYTDARDFDPFTMHYPSPLAWVSRDGLWGLVDKEGELAQPCQFEGFERPANDDGALGWRVLCQGRVGWLNADGSWAVPCEWEAVMPYQGFRSPRGLFEVVREGRHGVVAQGGDTWIACEYQGVQPIGVVAHALAEQHEWDGVCHRAPWPDDGDMSRYLATRDAAQAQLLFAVQAESGCGVVDQANRLLVPLVYRKVEAFDDLNDHDPRWLRLIAHDGRHGLWDMAVRAETFPCSFDHLAVISAAPSVVPVVVSVRRVVPEHDDLPSFRCGLHLTDGSPACEGDYLAIDLEELGYQWNRPAVRGLTASHCASIARTWAQGGAIRALQHRDGGPAQRVWLRPGRPPVPDAVWLQRQFQRGDLNAALVLARSHLDGFAQALDEVQARRWLARACGHEDTPAHAGEAPAEAMLLFARMLCQGRGGPADFPLARQWAQRALEAPSTATAEEAAVLLGMLLLDERAGPIDAPRAIDVFEGVGDRGLCAGEANFRLGLCLRDGVGTERDFGQALKKLECAETNHCPQAAAVLIDLLQTMVETAADPEDAAAWHERAFHYAQKQVMALEAKGYAENASHHASLFYEMPGAEAAPKNDGPGRAHAQLGLLLLQQEPTDWEWAETNLKRAAEAGHVQSMGQLWKGIYKLRDSPLRDPALARQWRDRYCQAVGAGKSRLFRMAFWLLARVMP
jgi:hypothetical protein